MTLDTKAFQVDDSAHYLHPFTDYKALAEKGSRVIVKAQGIYIWDSEGMKILDGMSGLWCCSLGLTQTELAQAALQQLETLPFYNSFFQTTNIPAIELAKKITATVNDHPKNYQYVFFTSSGSEANDTNIKLVLNYWKLLGQPKRRIFLSRENAYHGSTLAASALGGFSVMHE